jgi:hypothetical protein
MPQLHTKLSERASLPRVSKPKSLRDVPASLLAMFSRWRDDPSCPEEARATFDELADTVASVSRHRRQLYLEMARLYCDSPKQYDLLSRAINETVVRIRSGEFKPKCAEVFLSAALVLLIEKHSAASMSRIKKGDQEELRDFNNHIVRDRTFAFDTLVEAGLVICHTQPDGTVGYESAARKLLTLPALVPADDPADHRAFSGVVSPRRVSLLNECRLVAQHSS